MAVEKAAAYGIVMADKPWTWIIPFMRVIKYWKPNWELIYSVMYEDKIEECTLLFRRVASDFEREFDKEQE